MPKYVNRRGINKWLVIPSAYKRDQLYNRRLLSYYSLLYSAIWFQEVLVVIVVGVVTKSPLDAATVAALLGVPTSLAGLGFYKYLEAAKIQDCEKNKEGDNVATDAAGTIPPAGTQPPPNGP